MSKDKKTKLRSPDVKKVDLVDDGANPGAKIMLFKNKTGEPGDPKGGEATEGIVAKLLAGLGKALGWNPEQIEKAMGEVEAAEPKSTAISFDQKMFEQSRRRIFSEMWDFTYALNEALESVIRDQTLNSTQRQELLLGNVDQFITTVTAAIPVWVGGDTIEKDNDGEGQGVAKSGRKISAARMERMKQIMQNLEELITEAEANPESDEPPAEPAAKIKDEEVEGMIDKTKLSPEVLKEVEGLEKRATDAETAQKTAETERDTARTELQKIKDEHPTEEDIFKGMSPAARKIVEDLQKRAEAAETAEYVTKAKDLEALGVKADEFGPILKAIAKACPEQYGKMEETLKAAAAAMAKGEVFKEIGSGAGGTSTGTAAEQLQKRAEEIVKRDGVSSAAAWEKAGTEDPQLLAKYREEMRK